MSDSETTTKAAAKHERTYHRSRLLGADGPKIAGVPRHVLAGALSVADTRKQNLTRDDITKTVEAYRKRQVPVRITDKEAVR